MEARNLRDKPCLGPEALALAQHAFEQAWMKIAPRFAAGRHAKVRDVLTGAIMETVRVDSSDTAPFCEAGLDAAVVATPSESFAEPPIESCVPQPA